jgi:hypothetical protein
VTFSSNFAWFSGVGERLARLGQRRADLWNRAGA